MILVEVDSYQTMNDETISFTVIVIVFSLLTIMI
jgi:hypothetical protein